jgi:predicted transcriptional regulator
MKLNKNDEKVVATLKANKELTLAELSEKAELPTKKVFRVLKKLFENEMIDSMGRKYRLLTDKVPAAKAKDGEATADVEDTAEAEEE